MIDHDSRYRNCEVLRQRDADGREIAWLDRRIIPTTHQILAHGSVEDGDRLDLLAHRAYGDARQSWRIMDANPDPRPLTLADKAGVRLRLAQAGKD